MNHQRVTFQNLGASALHAKIIALGMGSERESELQLKPGLLATLLDVDVPEGTKQSEVELSFDGRSWVGLYVYRAPEKLGGTFGDPQTPEAATALIYYDASHQTRKRWVWNQPKAGKYVIAVDPLDVPPQGLTIHYRDVLIHPSFGAVYCADEMSAVGPGKNKTAEVIWNIGAAKPGVNRKLVADVALTSSGVGYSKASGATGAKKQLQIVLTPIATKVISILP
jgi:hypothetical protein